MLKTVDFQGQPFHFIGIGGIGMSALAYVLAKRKLPVSGSDIRSTHITKRLQSVGARVFNKQDATNLEFFQTPATGVHAVGSSAVGAGNGASSLRSPDCLTVELASQILPQVVCSTAIRATNAEYLAARERGCPIFHRSDLLAALIQDYESITVAGTHGKTTTSSLIGYLLVQAGLDPTIVVGGEVNAIGGNARLGESRLLVAEADESDGSLAKLSANIGVVTNIELDHPDHYQSLEEVIGTFQVFANQCETLVGCIDCQIVRDRLKPTISYSLVPDSGADYTASDVAYHARGTKARVWEKGTLLGELNIRLLGQHNLSNALAAVAVARQLGLKFAAIAEALASFEGAKRRFECRGQVNGITFIDDYAHHPSELEATLEAARLQAQDSQRVVAIFQPHRYSRTLAFLQEFAQSFQQADLTVITDIYSAGEPDLGEVSAQQLVDLIVSSQKSVFYQPSLKSVLDFLREILRPGDLVLFLGAGNLNQIIPELIDFYRQ